MSARNTQKKPPAPNQPKTWVVVTRFIIIILVVLGLVSSLFMGLIGSAYSAELSSIERPSVGSLNTGSLSAEGSSAEQLSIDRPSAKLLGTEQLGTPTQRFEPESGPESPEGTESPEPDGSTEALPQDQDRIDGRPEKDVAAITSDLPRVQSPMAGLCTKDGRLLFERDIDRKVPMASTTKMMTALVALETMQLDQMLKVTGGAASTEGTSAGLVAGTEISLRDCLYALLLPSGNDAAVVIAENNSGMENRFVQLMNAKAAELGMSSTHFVDASGLSDAPGLLDGTGPTNDDHYSTVRDYLLLARRCMDNPTFREIVATKHHEAEVGGQLLTFSSTSHLADYLAFAEPLGIKTGSTNEAGFCYVAAARYGGVELYAVVFDAITTEQRFADCAELLEWGFRHYRAIELLNTSQQVAEVALTSWIDKTVEAYVPATVRVDIFDLSGKLTQDITVSDIEGEATRGQSCGKIVWSQGGEVLTTSDIVVAQTVLAPDFWEGAGIFWERFFGGLWGSAHSAESRILLGRDLTIPEAPPIK